MRNLWIALWEQGPLSRAFKNFFITGNAWGMFYRASHEKDGKPKVMYNTKESALKACVAIEKKYGPGFSAYKCVYCKGYHIGKKRVK